MVYVQRLEDEGKIAWFIGTIIDAILIGCFAWLIVDEASGSNYRFDPAAVIKTIFWGAISIFGVGIVLLIIAGIGVAVEGIQYNRGFVTYEECYKEGKEWAVADIKSLDRYWDYEHAYGGARIGSAECTEIMN